MSWLHADQNANNGGYLLGTALFLLVFVAAVVAQISTRRFNKWVYWVARKHGGIRKPVPSNQEPLRLESQESPDTSENRHKVLRQAEPKPVVVQRPL